MSGEPTIEDYKRAFEGLAAAECSLNDDEGTVYIEVAKGSVEHRLIVEAWERVRTEDGALHELMKAYGPL